MDYLSDEQLINSCLAKNRGHCRLLYERYKNYVARLVWGYFKETELVRDLTQETFVRVFKGLKKLRDKSTFKTWLTRITVNLCRDRLRAQVRKSSKSHISIDDPESGGVKELPVQNHSADPQRRLLQEELKSVVAAAIDKLTPDHKTIIFLWNEGYSYNEISAIIKIPQKTVGSRIFYAKKELRNILMPYIEGNNQ